MTIFDRLFTQNCVRFKSYDNFHRGDIFENFYDLKGKSEKFNKK